MTCKMLPSSLEAVYRRESLNLKVELKLKFTFARFHLTFCSYSMAYIGTVQGCECLVSDDVDTVI